ncbi:hypothetical protein SAMN05421734_101330 [Pelagirhabdus alkalitolerans]|uniref:Uncharacterized protein n=1 Tax=Pelagirhabdus alkalitolerans TaxID=1612202 RepID=A0A1G6GNX4_9BACI|nr:hypothetical protein [Pelagirhabdus alkalitolerans]SDB83634.1 hypothetical protein SAMN05421734_101330 [Pelagirhabdus alkalitolerans]
MLLAEDQKDKEEGCLLYCLSCAYDEVNKGRLFHAEAYMNNAIRSLHELYKMTDSKPKEKAKP